MRESVSHELLHMSYGPVMGTVDLLGVRNAYRVALPPHLSILGILQMVNHSCSSYSSRISELTVALGSQYNLMKTL